MIRHLPPGAWPRRTRACMTESLHILSLANVASVIRNPLSCRYSMLDAEVTETFRNYYPKRYGVHLRAPVVVSKAGLVARATPEPTPCDQNVLHSGGHRSCMALIWRVDSPRHVLESLHDELCGGEGMVRYKLLDCEKSRVHYTRKPFP